MIMNDCLVEIVVGMLVVLKVGVVYVLFDLVFSGDCFCFMVEDSFVWMVLIGNFYIG